MKMNLKTNCTIRTRVAETDSLGVIYYGNFFTYFEVARFECLKSIGCEENELRYFFLHTYVLDTRCTFKSPVQALDEIEIETELSELKEKTFKFSYILKSKETQRDCAEGYSLGIFVDENGKGIRIPSWFMVRVKAYKNKLS